VAEPAGFARTAERQQRFDIARLKVGGLGGVFFGQFERRLAQARFGAQTQRQRILRAQVQRGGQVFLGLAPLAAKRAGACAIDEQVRVCRGNLDGVVECGFRPGGVAGEEPGVAGARQHVGSVGVVRRVDGQALELAGGEIGLFPADVGQRGAHIRLPDMGLGDPLPRGFVASVGVLIDGGRTLREARAIGGLSLGGGGGSGERGRSRERLDEEKSDEHCAPMGERDGEGKPGGSMVALGFGYVAQTLTSRLRRRGWTVLGSNRTGRGGALKFDGTVTAVLAEALAGADAVLTSIPPGPDGCPAAAVLPQLTAGWVGYLSTTGVYGDLAGRWAFEWSRLNPTSDIAERRLRAEAQWLARGAHLFRLPGIYGPGRSAFDRLRAGDAQRIVKPGQVFSRAHVEDIAAALEASIARPNPGRAYNICDDEPAPPQDVITEAARLIGVPPPPETAYDEAVLSPMARRFYQDSKRVSNARAKAELGWRPAYATYREGLAAILAAERQA